MKKIKKEFLIGGRKLIVEIRGLAENANGEALVRYGDTEVLSVVVMSKEEVENPYFFPLSVEYQERYYAAGKIIGPRYIRREGRPSDEAIAIARMVDRTIRPLFPSDLKRAVQVVTTCLSWDGENDPGVLAILATSIALSISDIPWEGPVGAVRIGKNGEEFTLNPTYQEREEAELEMVFSGIKKGGKFLINMMEGKGNETKESDVIEAFEKSKGTLQKLVDFQEEIRKEVGKEKIPIVKIEDPNLEREAKEFLGKKIEEIIEKVESQEQSEKLEELKEKLLSHLEESFPEEKERNFLGIKIFQEEIKKAIARKIIQKKERPDGRKLNELRKIEMNVGLLPRTHGSGLFSRGKTRTLSILTLGAPGDVQILEGMEITGKKRFIHHYNFPPYSAGEIAPIRGPGRREIGHGMLAERALLPVIPDFDDFPYTIRIVSEVLSSNGSTSMSSVCSSSLSLMDAGVPVKKHVAGIAMGIIEDKEGNYEILTDIQGVEDHYGGMDFKVAGTKTGVTAIQMDVKIPGIDKEILEKALNGARRARLEIIEKMEKVISKPREKISPFAPKIYKIQINPEKIRDVIGPGGKVIHEIIEKCEVSIDIEDDGKIYVTGESEEAAKKAIAWIKNITREVKVGEVFQGKVKRLLAFGAIVELFPGQEGLIHISSLGRVKKISDVLKVGDVVSVKVKEIDELGRINLYLLKNNSRPQRRTKFHGRR